MIFCKEESVVTYSLVTEFLVPAVQDYAFIKNEVLFKFLILPIGEPTPERDSFGSAC